MFGISGVCSVVRNQKTFFLNFSKIFGKTAMFGVVGNERKNIAKRINETGRIYADDMDEIKRVM